METMLAPTALEYNLSPADLNAILLHKYLLSNERHTWVSMPDTILDFYAEREVPHPREGMSPLKSHAQKFGVEKAIHDWKDQQYEITKAIDERQEKIGRELTSEEKDEATELWLLWKAAEWRKNREDIHTVFGDNYQPIIIPEIPNSDALQKRVISKVCPYWCDIFGYQEGMKNPDFIFQGKPYQDINRRIKHEKEDLVLIPHKQLELILLGDKSKEAKEGLKKLCNGMFCFELPEEPNGN